MIQLCTKIIKTESIYKVIKMPSWKARVQRPSGLIKSERKRKHLRDNILIKVDNFS